MLTLSYEKDYIIARIILDFTLEIFSPLNTVIFHMENLLGERKTNSRASDRFFSSSAKGLSTQSLERLSLVDVAVHFHLL